MVTRRSLLVGVSTGLLVRTLAARISDEQTQLVLQHDLPDLALHDWSATLVEVSYPPGASSSPHTHPGITIAYVLEGSIRSKVGEQPERTFTSGQAFVELPGQLHAVSRNASDSEPARLLAVLLGEKGKPLTTVVRK